jgi:hypothetical protein
MELLLVTSIINQRKGVVIIFTALFFCKFDNLCDKARIEFPASARPYTLKITDIYGRVQRTIKNIGTSFIDIEKGNLKPGIYFIRLEGENMLTGKILVE